jgi:hypothetical protein
MTVRHTPPFRADHVGSFLRPKALLDAREQNKNGSLSRERLRQVEDAAIRDIVRFQEDLGLKGITDGEFRRTYFHIDFLEQLQGVETKGGRSNHLFGVDSWWSRLLPALRSSGGWREWVSHAPTAGPKNLAPLGDDALAILLKSHHDPLTGEA